MKKILSTLLVAAMLLSLVIVVAVPASAVDGIWDSMGTATTITRERSIAATSNVERIFFIILFSF